MKLRYLAEGFAQFLYPTTPRAQFALRSTIAIIICAIVSFVLHLQDPYWAGISALFIMTPNVGATVENGVLWVIGTIIGSLLGLALATIAVNSLFLFLLFGFLIIAVGAYCSVTARHPFAFLFGTLAAFYILSNLVTQPGETYFNMIYRTQEILVGVAAGWIASIVVFPVNAKCQLQQKIVDTAQALSQISQLLIQQYYHEQDNAITIKQLLKDINQELASFDELYRFSKMEFGNTVFTTRLSKDLWQIEAIIYKQLEAIFINFDATLSYHVLNDPELPIKPLLQGIASELTTIANYLHAPDPSQALIHSAQALYQTFNTAFNAFTDNRKMLNYPIEESTAFHSLILNIETIVNALDKFIQLCHEITSIDARPRDAEYTPFFRLDTNKETLQFAIKAGLAIVLATVIWIGSDWPAGIQGIISTGIIAFQRNMYDVQIRGELRFLGALIGGAVGLAALYCLPVVGLSLFLTLWVFGWIFAYFTFGNRRYSYAALQANLTLVIIMLQSSSQPTNIAPALQRLAGVFIAIISTVLIYRFVWPTHPRRLLRDGIYHLSEKIADNFRHLQQKPYPNQHQLDADTTATNAQFIRNYELLESLRHYLNENDPFIIEANRLLDVQRQCATLVCAIAKSTDLNMALCIAADYQLDLQDYLTKTCQILTPVSIDPLVLLTVDQTQQAQILAQELSQALHATRQQTIDWEINHHSRAAITQLLYLINNLRQLLHYCMELTDHFDKPAPVATIAASN